MLADELQDVAFLFGFPRDVDDHFQLPAIGQEAHALRIARLEADRVKQCIRSLRIETCRHRGMRGVVKRRSAKHGIRALGRQPEEQRLVEILSINRLRQRPTEPHIPQQLAPRFIIRIQVRIKGKV
jgi:hypothetical protein